MPIGLESKAAFSSSFPFFSIIQLILTLFLPYSVSHFNYFQDEKSSLSTKYPRIDNDKCA